MHKQIISQILSDPLVILLSISLYLFIVILKEKKKIFEFFFLLFSYCKPYAIFLWPLCFLVYIGIVDSFFPPNFKFTFGLLLMPDNRMYLIWASCTSKDSVDPLVMDTDPLAFLDYHEFMIPLDMLIIYQWSMGLIILSVLVFKNKFSIENYFLLLVCYFMLFIIFFYSCFVYLDWYS